MEAKGLRFLRLVEETGPSKNPVELVSECFRLKGGPEVGGPGWMCVGDKERCSEGEICHPLLQSLGLP